MKQRFALLLFVLIAAVSCTTNSTQEITGLTAQEIIDKAIDAAGGEIIANSSIDFDFRKRHYKSIRSGGKFQNERILKDSLITIRDVLTNDRFERYINDTISTLTPDSMKVKYANSVNSVVYFALLPYGLNDPAVIKKCLKEVRINEKEYYKIQISFQQEGGGKDYDDVFVYWIEKQSFYVDYFGYTYLTDGGGARFRSAYNSRVINGVRFADYINYKPTGKRFDVAAFDIAFAKGELKELSRIVSKNVSVSISE